MLRLGVITCAVLWPISVCGYQPRQLLVKSAFVRHKTKQIRTKGKIIPVVPPHLHRHQQSEVESTTYQRTCSVLKIRGGAFSAYDKHDEGYGYDANGSFDDEMKDYENKYRSGYNEYDQPGSYGSQDRYGETFYSRQSENGYYDDEGRYHEDYDDRRERGTVRYCRCFFSFCVLPLDVSFSSLLRPDFKPYQLYNISKISGESFQQTSQSYPKS